MKLLYLEARKGILRRYVLVALTLFLCLNVIKITADYRAGEIRPIAANNDDMQNAYSQIYERARGPVTAETIGFITSEYHRLRNLTADGTYSRERTKGTYSGYIFGDFYLLHKYFYPNAEYTVKYPNRMNNVLAQAMENVDFYLHTGNTTDAARNSYILRHYANRSIPEFHLYDGWEALLSYDFSDLLILLLLVLTVSPIFTREKENEMTLILSSSKRGKWPLVASKCGVVVLLSVALTALFALCNVLTFGLLCGFEGWNSPLYAIENYQYTPFSDSVLLFYLLNVSLKAIGFSIMGLVLVLLSALCEKTLTPCLVGLGFGVAFCYFSGWAVSAVWWKQALSCISPLTLLQGWLLLKNLYGIGVGETYVLSLYLLLAIQFIFASLLVFLIWRKSCCALK